MALPSLGDIVEANLASAVAAAAILWIRFFLSTLLSLD
jgi:ABC-type transport system involved in cytochrome c biogenesis permease component